MANDRREERALLLDRLGHYRREAERDEQVRMPERDALHELNLRRQPTQVLRALDAMLQSAQRRTRQQERRHGRCSTRYREWT